MFCSVPYVQVEVGIFKKVPNLFGSFTNTYYGCLSSETLVLYQWITIA